MSVGLFNLNVIFIFNTNKMISRGGGPAVSGTLATNSKPDREGPPVSLTVGSPETRRRRGRASPRFRAPFEVRLVAVERGATRASNGGYPVAGGGRRRRHG